MRRGSPKPKPSRLPLGTGESCAINVTIGSLDIDVCVTENQQRVLFNGKTPKKPLGCGTTACAWDRGDGTVVKLTIDSSDVHAMAALNGSPYVAKVHKVYELAQPSRDDLGEIKVYAAVVDKLEPLPYQDKMSFDEAYAESTGVVKNACKRMAPELADRCFTMRGWIEDAKANFEERGVTWTDIGADNVGLDAKGQIRALDVGYSKVVNQHKLDKLAGGLGSLTRRRRQASLAAPPHLEPMIQAKERELVKFKTERGVLYDEDGRIVLEKKGTKTRLKFDEDDVALFPNRYLTHNHPPTKFGEFDAGNSLSVADVYVAAKRNLAEVRAVTKLPIGGQQRTVLYRLERPHGGWPAAWKIKDEAEVTSNRVMWQLSADLAAKRRTHEEVAAAVMHETWLELAPKFGFKYDRVVLDGAELGRAPRRRRVVKSR